MAKKQRGSRVRRTNTEKGAADGGGGARGKLASACGDASALERESFFRFFFYTPFSRSIDGHTQGVCACQNIRGRFCFSSSHSFLGTASARSAAPLFSLFHCRCASPRAAKPHDGLGAATTLIAPRARSPAAAPAAPAASDTADRRE
jgi:hypothetical protein